MAMAMKTQTLGLLWMMSIALVTAQEPQPYLVLEYNFDNGNESWSPVFADYNEASAADGLNATVSLISPVPEGQNATRAWRLATSNRADDIYAGIKTKVTGLPANAKFTFKFDVEIASKAGDGCFGVGGSPGGSVWVKAGATTFEPQVLYKDGLYVFDPATNKGQQTSNGPAGSVLGNVAVPEGSCDSHEDVPYFPKVFTNHTHSPGDESAMGPYQIKTSKKGSMWLLVGTESGFEGYSVVYFKKVTAYLYLWNGTSPVTPGNKGKRRLLQSKRMNAHRRHL